MPDASRSLLAATGVLAATTVWSAYQPYDLPTWFLEAGPVLVAVPLVWALRRRFPLTPLSHLALALHGVILLVGAHYTYAEVPLGHWARDAFDLDRNHYDRLGHVAQGFFPAIWTREVLLRTSTLRRGGWLAFLTVATCLAISAFYELLEWWTATIFAPEQGPAFLATQGDPWDTQWDMFLALCGATLATLTLRHTHDRQMGTSSTSQLAGSTTD